MRAHNGLPLEQEMLGANVSLRDGMASAVSSCTRGELRDEVRQPGRRHAGGGMVPTGAPRRGRAEGFSPAGEDRRVTPAGTSVTAAAASTLGHAGEMWADTHPGGVQQPAVSPEKTLTRAQVPPLATPLHMGSHHPEGATNVPSRAVGQLERSSTSHGRPSAGGSPRSHTHGPATLVLGSKGR